MVPYFRPNGRIGLIFEKNLPNIIILIKLLCRYVNMSMCPGVRRTASDYDLVLNSHELSISVLKIESLSSKF